jgi:hypothetical protein
MEQIGGNDQDTLGGDFGHGDLLSIIINNIFLCKEEKRERGKRGKQKESFNYV